MSRLVLVLIIVSAITYTQIRADVEYARELIIKHEGFRSKPYIDVSHFSVGYGTNLMNGISKAEAILLLDYRLTQVETKLLKHSWYYKLNYKRRSIILDMSYNLGYGGIMKFKSMIWCLNNGFFNAAANHMKKSLWYKQTGYRAKELVKLMKD